MTYKINGRQIILYEKGKPDDKNIIENQNDDIQQTKIISGLVTSVENELLSGVNIIVIGTTIGNITDINSKYQIIVPANADTLVFSFVGMKTRKIPILGRSVINIRMEYTTTALKEVVAVGYGVQKKESVVGAVAQTSSKELM